MTRKADLHKSNLPLPAVNQLQTIRVLCDPTNNFALGNIEKDLNEYFHVLGPNSDFKNLKLAIYKETISRMRKFLEVTFYVKFCKRLFVVLNFKNMDFNILCYTDGVLDFYRL